jgi:hypothetical protein
MLGVLSMDLAADIRRRNARIKAAVKRSIRQGKSDA